MDIRKGNRSLNPFQHVAQIIKIAFIGSIVFVTVLSLNHFNISSYFPIKTVRVYGINRINQTEVKNLLLPLVENGFFKVNVDYIRDQLQQISWVSHIFVRRNWPDLVEITVFEKKPLARWNTESLLSESGELFSPRKETYPAELPQFVGPEGKQVMMLEYFYSMNRLFAPIHAKISYLEMTPYLTWKLKLNNGITLHIGHKDILTRIKHFVKVYPKIIGNRAKDVESIDLRYSNGVAVRFKRQ